MSRKVHDPQKKIALPSLNPNSKAEIFEDDNARCDSRKEGKKHFEWRD
jgi:hypothetical protein